MPGAQGLLGEPDRDGSPPNQRGIVFRPVRHPVSGCRDLTAAALTEFVRHGVPQPGASDSTIYPTVRRSALPSVLAFDSTFVERILREVLPHDTTHGLSVHQRVIYGLHEH